MKRREGKGAPTDLLVCFPTRAHLTLMPKAICSPARGSGTNKNSLHLHQHHLRKSSIRRGGSIGGGSHGSPYMLSKTKQMGSDYSEPTSPKVTCAGQIRVRPRANPCKSWQSVMEEIEKLHNNKQKKKATWVEALGFKKEVMQFLTCLRRVKFDFRCFGSFPHANVTSDDDEDDEEEDKEDDHHHHQQNQQELDDQEGSSKAVFSKWFMVLQENQHPGIAKDKDTRERERDSSVIDNPPCGPPPNALLLMRCRSAPAKSWQEEKEEEEEEDDDEEEEYENEDEKNDEREIEKRKLEEEIQRKDNSDMKEEEKEKKKKKKKKRESLEELMRHESDFDKFSSDIAKETWVVGGIKDILSRSKSSRR